jgi:hypothetical protein
MADRRLTTEIWRITLDRGVGRWRLTALRHLAADVAGAQDRCQRLASGDPGIGALPDALGRDLRALSIRLTTDLDTGYRVIAERTLSAALGHRPGPVLGQRVAQEVRGICAARPAEILLVTPTGGVTAARGTRALAAFCAEHEPVVRPVEVGLDASCQVLWRHRTGVDPGLWLQQALDSVAARLLTEVVARCQEVHGALARTLAGLQAAQFQYPQREPQVKA